MRFLPTLGLSNDLKLAPPYVYAALGIPAQDDWTINCE
jgi:hypothetical protein